MIWYCCDLSCVIGLYRTAFREGCLSLSVSQIIIFICVLLEPLSFQFSLGITQIFSDISILHQYKSHYVCKGESVYRGYTLLQRELPIYNIFQLGLNLFARMSDTRGYPLSTYICMYIDPILCCVFGVVLSLGLLCGHLFSSQSRLTSCVMMFGKWYFLSWIHLHPLEIFAYHWMHSSGNIVDNFGGENHRNDFWNGHSNFWT